MPRKATRRQKVNPLTAADSPVVRAAIERGELHWVVAQERLSAALRGGRIWRSEEWTALRGRLIKDYCEQCQAGQGPFTLQHFWHPPTIADSASELRHAFRIQLWEEFQLRAPFVEATENRSACPRCESVNIHSRHSIAPRWKCNAHKGGRTCGYEFDEPVSIEAPAYRANAAGKRERWAQFQAEYANRLGEVADVIYIEATLQVLELFERYMAGERTATFCGRCAYMWDKCGLRLCQTCHSEWHKHHELGCAVCTSGVRYVLCSVCGEQRHSDVYQTCLDCARQRDDPRKTNTADEELTELDEQGEGAHERDRRSQRGPRPGGGRASRRRRSEDPGPRLAVSACVIGARVLHERFGSGTIKVALHGDGRQFVVLFDNADWGTKLLNIEYAPLQRLRDSETKKVQED
jgi:hypothetical protein